MRLAAQASRTVSPYVLRTHPEVELLTASWCSPILPQGSRDRLRQDGGRYQSRPVSWPDYWRGYETTRRRTM